MSAESTFRMPQARSTDGCYSGGVRRLSLDFSGDFAEILQAVLFYLGLSFIFVS